MSRILDLPSRQPTQQTAQHPLLFTLPQEVRHHIWRYSLKECIAKLDVNPFSFGRPLKLLQSKHIVVEEKVPMSNIRIMLVCRQTWKECQQVLFGLPQALVLPTAVPYIDTIAFLTRTMNTPTLPLFLRLKQARRLVLQFAHFQQYLRYKINDDEHAVRYTYWLVLRWRLLARDGPLRKFMEMADIPDFVIAWHKTDDVWITFRERYSIITLHRRSRDQLRIQRSQHVPGTCQLPGTKILAKPQLTLRCACSLTGNVDTSEYWVSYKMEDVWPSERFA